MRLVFAGTPDFACPCFDELQQAGHEILLVVTQPDRPCGRGYRLTEPPVKKEAGSLGLEVAQPERIDTPEFRGLMEELHPDALVVVAFGLKIPSWLLDLPRHGCLNVHASLLPRYRGAAPIQRAIMNGERETGVTIMRLDEGWDTGPVICQRKLEIGCDEDSGSLHDRLAKAGSELLITALDGLEAGTLRPVPQDDASATKAPKIKDEERQLDWSRPAGRLHDLVRALSPAPLAETNHGERRLKIMRTKLAGTDSAVEPGTVLEAGNTGVKVRAGSGALVLLEVKPEARKAMSAADYARGYGLEPGTKLG